MRPIRELMQDKRVAGALAAVALVFVAYRVVQSTGTSPPPAGRSADAPSSPAATEPPPAAFEPVAAPPPAEFPPGWSGPSWTWERNPFLPPARERIPGRAGGAGNGGEARPAGTGTDGGVPELRGTVVSRESSMAIFRSHRPDGGNRLVPVGGTIGEWTLVAVDPYRVSLRKGSEIRVLELYRQ
ncbi:MAG: hypothetical protein C4529_06355 [Deltaproteobacteria bacterium]|nr:MAG: hypothetical protein C4529_06355 [Deltaproteobacteria bacterium]